MTVRDLCPELAAKARQELNEDPARLRNDLQHIKDWLSKQSHLRARTDEQFLVAFLRGCKFSLERTKEKLELYYTVRTTTPDLYSVRYPQKKFMDILETGAILILPKTSAPDAPRVNLIRPGAFSADAFHISEIMSVSYMLQQICFMEDDNAIVSGFEVILDLEGVSFAHFLQMTPIQIKNIVVSSQDAAPIRMKGIHCLNTPPGFETIFNAMKSLLNEKTSKRLQVENRNYEALYKAIPQNILPAEYGGDGGTVEDIIGYWKNKLQEYSSFLEDDQKYGADESKRQKNLTIAKSGLEGSFRQLQVD